MTQLNAPNHIHLIAGPKTPDALRRAIGEAHRRYIRLVNFREGWRGRLWQGRFASFVMRLTGNHFPTASPPWGWEAKANKPIHRSLLNLRSGLPARHRRLTHAQKIRKLLLGEVQPLAALTNLFGR